MVVSAGTTPTLNQEIANHIAAASTIQIYWLLQESSITEQSFVRLDSIGTNNDPRRKRINTAHANSELRKKMARKYGLKIFNVVYTMMVVK